MAVAYTAINIIQTHKKVQELHYLIEMDIYPFLV